MNEIVQFLQDIGCFEIKHSGESLGDHLVGTAQLLELADAEFYVVLAGGLHSIYGTASFKKSTLLDIQRSEISSRFGDAVERLAYIFCHVSGASSIEQAPDDGGYVINRKNEEKIYLSRKDVEDLRLISAANLLEQDAPSLSKFPKTIKLFESKISKVC